MPRRPWIPRRHQGSAATSALRCMQWWPPWARRRPASSHHTALPAGARALNAYASAGTGGTQHFRAYSELH